MEINYDGFAYHWGPNTWNRTRFFGENNQNIMQHCLFFFFLMSCRHNQSFIPRVIVSNKNTILFHYIYVIVSVTLQ